MANELAGQARIACPTRSEALCVLLDPHASHREGRVGVVIFATCTSYPVFGSSDVSWNTLKFEPLISACRKMPSLGVYHFVIALKIFEERLSGRSVTCLPLARSTMASAA